MSNVSRVNPDAMEMERSLLAEMEAEGRLRSACDLLRHAVWGAAFVEEEVEEVRRRAGRGMKVVHAGVATLADTRIRGGAPDALWMSGRDDRIRQLVDAAAAVGAGVGGFDAGATTWMIGKLLLWHG